jgi:hypothetical protein
MRKTLPVKGSVFSTHQGHYAEGATMVKHAVWKTIIAPLGALMLWLPGLCNALEWDRVPIHDILLFYPGQSSWEWLLTQSDHSGAKDIREGKVCQDCHDGEQMAIGEKIASGKKLEPRTVSTLRPFIPLSVQVAHDTSRFYVRLKWPESDRPAPSEHGDKAQTMVTMMLGDKHIPEFQRGGCWGACHDDLRGMPSASTGHELSKYLIESRTKVTRQGGGGNYKSDEQLQALLKQGAFLEYWQARLNAGKKSVPYDGYILAKRHQGKPSSELHTEATLKNGYWTVVLSRRLSPGQPQYKALVPGKVYTVGFAIHDNYSTHRHHDVSLEYTLRLDSGQADLVAKPQ